jgi:hypothetical protein
MKKGIFLLILLLCFDVKTWFQSLLSKCNLYRYAALRLQVQQLERDKAAIMARAEAAEKRHKNLLQEKRVFIGD